MHQIPKGRDALKWAICLFLSGPLLFILSGITIIGSAACTAQNPVGAYNGNCGNDSIAGYMIILAIVAWITSLILGIIAAITWEYKERQ